MDTKIGQKRSHTTSSNKRAHVRLNYKAAYSHDRRHFVFISVG